MSYLNLTDLSEVAVLMIYRQFPESVEMGESKKKPYIFSFDPTEEVALILEAYRAGDLQGIDEFQIFIGQKAAQNIIWDCFFQYSWKEVMMTEESARKALQKIKNASP